MAMSLIEHKLGEIYEIVASKELLSRLRGNQYCARSVEFCQKLTTVNNSVPIYRGSYLPRFLFTAVPIYRACKSPSK